MCCCCCCFDLHSLWSFTLKNRTQNRTLLHFYIAWKILLECLSCKRENKDTEKENTRKCVKRKMPKEVIRKDKEGKHQGRKKEQSKTERIIKRREVFIPQKKVCVLFFFFSHWLCSSFPVFSGLQKAELSADKGCELSPWNLTSGIDRNL